MSTNEKENEWVENKKKKSFFLSKNFILPFLIIVLAAAGGTYWYIGQLAFVTTDDAYIDANSFEVSAKMMGRIMDLEAEESDTVYQNQLLVELDSSDLIAQKEQASALLELNKESISLAEVDLKRAEDDFNRAKEQYKNRIIPKEKYDHALSALEAAKAGYKIAITKVGTAKAQLNLIETQLKNTKINSPVKGVVAKKWVMNGDVVSPGQPVFTLFETKNVWVSAYLEETKLASVQIGDTVDITVDTYPDQKFEGKIYQIGSNTASKFALIPPSNASGNFTKVTQRVPIKISIEPVYTSKSKNQYEKIKLLPGMSAEIKVKV